MTPNKSPAILDTGHMVVLAAVRPHHKLGLCFHCFNLWMPAIPLQVYESYFFKQRKCILSQFLRSEVQN